MSKSFPDRLAGLTGGSLHRFAQDKTHQLPRVLFNPWSRALPRPSDIQCGNSVLAEPASNRLWIDRLVQIDQQARAIMAAGKLFRECSSAEQRAAMNDDRPIGFDDVP